MKYIHYTVTIGYSSCKQGQTSVGLVAMAQFSKEDLSFVKVLPEHLEIECPICFNILTDPHQVTCCGKNFCEACIERVKASNGPCPTCKKEEYQSFIDKKCSLIINGLEVYCSNKEKGCHSKGELKNLSTHLNKEKREGECQYEEVKCRYQKCQERKQRRYLKDHEDKECPHRPFQCQYCSSKGTFLSITKDHYEECRQYPVTCPNKCVSTTMPRGSLTAHINECQLEPVDCVFSWAGCNDKPLRKDVDEHATDTKHLTLLAKACGQLKKEKEKIKEETKEENEKIKGEMKKENEKIKEEMKKENEKIKEEIKKEKEKIKEEMRKENEKIKKEVVKLKEENIHLKKEDRQLKDHVHYAIVHESFPLLPIDITIGSEAVLFYASVCGLLMSARVMRKRVPGSEEMEVLILFAIHKGKFDKFKPKRPEIFAWPNISLLEYVEATDQLLRLSQNSLNTISSFDDYPKGVFRAVVKAKVELKSITIHTK